MSKVKVNVEVCVARPADSIGVVETLIKHDFAVVIRANAYDDCAPTIFVHGYGEYDGDPKAGHGLLDYFDRMLVPVGGGVAECHEGHQDSSSEVVPPVDLQFAIDVLDDHNDVLHRISCTKYTRERAFLIAIQAAGLLANARYGKSVGNALARRLLLAALGPIDDEDDDDGEVMDAGKDGPSSVAA